MTDISPWNQQKIRLRQERGYECELCGKSQGAEEQDHAIVSKARYRKKIPELDQEQNIILLCGFCNQRKPEKYWIPYNSYEEWAWERNCKRYGKNHMQQWMDNVPLKIKPTFTRK